MPLDKVRTSTYHQLFHPEMIFECDGIGSDYASGRYGHDNEIEMVLNRIRKQVGKYVCMHVQYVLRELKKNTPECQMR